MPSAAQQVRVTHERVEHAYIEQQRAATQPVRDVIPRERLDCGEALHDRTKMELEPPVGPVWNARQILELTAILR